MTTKTPEQVADRAINLWNAYIAGRISKDDLGAGIIRFVEGTPRPIETQESQP